MSTATEQVDEKARGAEKASGTEADDKSAVDKTTTTKPKKAAIEGC